MAAVISTIVAIIVLVWGGARSGAQGGGTTAVRTPTPFYAVLIDAGSSGSRVHVYNYTVGIAPKPTAWCQLRSLSAAAAAATRRVLGRVTGLGASDADTEAAEGPPDAPPGKDRDLGSAHAAHRSEHTRSSSRGSAGADDRGRGSASYGSSSGRSAGVGAATGSLLGSSSGGGGDGPRGVPLLQRYPDVALPGRVHRIHPGLSSLAPAGEGAADYLAPLLDFARQQVPAELHAVTPIRLLATAGLRLLPAEQQQQVLAAAAQVLAGSGFLFVHPAQQQPQPLSGPQAGSQAGSQSAVAAPRRAMSDGVHGRLLRGSPEESRGGSGGSSASDATPGPGGSGRVPAEELRAEAAVAAGAAAWVRVLSGDQEGLYAWAGINFAAGRLQALAAQAAVSPRQRDAAAWLRSEAAATLAVFELGGASMQVTLMPWEPLPGGLGHQLALPGVTRPLYTHSFLGYGLHVAWFRGAMLVADGGEAAADPCLNPGYTSASSGVTGSGNFSGCVALAEQLLGVGDGQQPGGAGGGCRHKRCSIGSEYLPALLPPFNRSGSSSGRAVGGSSSADAGFLIMATEAFHYTISHLRLQPSASLEELAAAGAAFCARPWSEVEQELVQGRGVDEDHALKLCFGAAYIHTMLSKGFKLSAEEAAHLRFSNWVTRVDGTQVEVNWVLGALLAEVVPEQLRRLGQTAAGQALQGNQAAAGAADPQPGVATSSSGGGMQTGTGSAGSAMSARGLLAGGLVALVLVSGLLCCGVAAARGEDGVGGRGGAYRSRRGGGPAAAGTGLTAALASVVVKVVDAGGGGGAGGGWAGRLGSMWGGTVDAAAYAAADPASAVAAGPGAPAVAPVAPGSSSSGATAGGAGGPSPSALSLFTALGLGTREGSHGGSSGAAAAAAKAAQRRVASGLQASVLGAGGVAAWATGDVPQGGAAGGGAEAGEELGGGAVASGSTAGVTGSLEQRRGARAAVAML
ncbi:hypothetical protein HXX76_003611 [Chlamydomonas incerta]|uniref:Apyrase n=1 Tax=Chlamydomonas incerta TaxID=51695 RepID=A0A835T8H2_CHLIN|nr:hypothetical protein HXX76_003611 [Chlamydomonas incerta]|eukprot:KAG2440754.1 hypothetical protein HXX76_003611 [Chlamydomonas incerta]